MKLPFYAQGKGESPVTPHDLDLLHTICRSHDERIRELEKLLGENIAHLHNFKIKFQKYCQGDEKTPEPANNIPKWRKWQGRQINSIPEQHKIYLVSSKNKDGEYYGPYRAYYEQTENKFLSLDYLLSMPLNVDIFIELPEFPNE